MSKTYLSIDLDFWNDLPPSKAENYLIKLFKAAKKKNIPIFAVMNHQQLTKLVDRSKATKLINIDEHSDLADFTVKYYNCGTWVSYLKQRKKMVYEWIHRHGTRHGDCNRDNPLFGKRCRTDQTDFKRITHKRVKAAPAQNALLRSCNSIGFCLSPGYSQHKLQSVFYELVDQFDIPYVDGDEWEFGRGTRRDPPEK